MKRPQSVRKIWKGTLWTTGLIILLLLAIMWYKVISFDTEECGSNSADKSPDAYFEVQSFDSTWSSWETVIQMSSDPEDLEVFTGTTFDCSIVNKKSYEIKDWTLRLDIVQECFISGFWCGGFEIHQFRGGTEIVNMLENQKVDLSNTSIELNTYSDVALINLLPGDYIIYLPSKDFREELVFPKDSKGIGFNLYYQDKMDLSHWTLTYYNNLKMTDMLLFRIIMIATVVWLLMLIFFLGFGFMEKGLEKQINNRIRNLSIMADLFVEAYIIDVNEKSAHLIKGNADNMIMDLVDKDVQETLYDLIDSRCQDAYRDELKEFLNLSTAFDRMKTVASISYDFVDVQIGWCSIRLFKGNERENNRQLVLALQNINEEKRKLSLIEARMNLAEYKQNVSGSFLATVSYALNDISAKVMNDGRAVLKATDQEEISLLADQIVMNTRHMNLIQNMMLDLYEIECKNLKLNILPYSVYDMVDEVVHILKPSAENSPFEFTVDVDPNIPAKLMGDRDRIEQILVIILFSSMLMTQSGFVKFSVFGKRYANEEEMIFSIRDSAQGFSNEQLTEIHEFINGSSIETFDNASLVYLKTINGILSYMNSELKIVSVLNEGTDFYFTIRQEVVD